MLTVVRKLRPTIMNEDVWYSRACVALGLNIAPKDITSYFSSETIFNKDSCAVHKPHFGEDELRQFINNVKW